MSAAAQSDADLVAATLSGNRDAFGQIVSRYQSLICSLAYSATGNLGGSEDLAQETFITAWKHLNRLRERDKLRAWLCGIARNRINNCLRREGREPVHAAEPLENAPESVSAAPLPHDQAVSREEEAILWRSLERIPDTYREPLVLFYREHQSIEAVAKSLELSEDAVKQRLSRGRKLLQEEVASFVEGALERTNPGQSFTAGVLSALPGAVATSAKITTLGAAAKGAAAKSAGMGVLSIVLSPISILFGNYLGYKMAVDKAASEVERAQTVRLYRRILLTALALTTGFAVFLFTWNPAELYVGTMCGMVFVAAITFYVMAVIANVMMVAVWHRKHARAATSAGGAVPVPPAFEYRTRATFLGLPLVYVRLGERPGGLRGPVKAWIAVGNFAMGGLFAFGGIAVAPVAVGLLGVGILPLAGLALGVFSMGAIAAGGWAYGGLAIGWQALGCFAFAWNTAIGDIAIAHDLAFGHVARAALANDPAARQVLLAGWFSKTGYVLERWSLLLNLVWIAPLFIQSRLVARRRKSA